MDFVTTFTSAFEPALIEEIHRFGDLKKFREGDIIMDYGKYVHMMPIVISGILKVLRMDENGKEILLYYLSSN